MLGDEYISQHVSQAYREYLERTSYKVYMSTMTKNIASALGIETESSWKDILDELDSFVAPVKQTESEEEIKNRILAELNGKEG